MAIEHSKEKKKTFVLAWLDCRNAFGSIPHAFQELFQSLPVPDQLRKVLIDIYHDMSCYLQWKKTPSPFTQRRASKKAML